MAANVRFHSGPGQRSPILHIVEGLTVGLPPNHASLFQRIGRLTLHQRRCFPVVSNLGMAISAWRLLNRNRAQKVLKSRGQQSPRKLEKNVTGTLDDAMVIASETEGS